MSISIRPLQPADRQAWLQMRRALWDDLSDQQNSAEVNKMLADKNFTIYFVVDRNDTPIGFAEVSIRDYANGCTQTPVPFLEGIWIDGDHRRSGAGRELVARITNDLRDQGYVELCSDILETNRQSHRAHENWGFKETERVVYFRKGLV